MTEGRGRGYRRTDQLPPAIPGSSSVCLGNNLKDYSAHVIALTLSYRFK